LKQSSSIFTGILTVFGLSFAVMAMMPAFQLNALQPQVNEDLGDIYPIDVSGVQAEGRVVYVAQGCVSCHTEQVRGLADGADLARGWGVRRTVARDYIYEKPVLLGTMRFGPDLANIGARKDKNDPNKYTPAWHYMHLYDPQATSPGTNMPSYKFLFEKRKIAGEMDADALNLPAGTVPDGYQMVPSMQARQLVAYLTSLDHSHALPEAGPNIQQPKSGVSGGAAK
jgi:cytochrome c oxidase cbb3-type subunit 2